MIRSIVAISCPLFIIDEKLPVVVSKLESFFRRSLELIPPSMPSALATLPPQKSNEVENTEMKAKKKRRKIHFINLFISNEE